ncbi:DUF3304 domain-containing protein [Massilia sp. AB1]|uniref:DUF3304 domain-containing protein n=1 Tax=Massilia sp. AB1 TaxID=2823371 RepID=UPI001B817288|nr:DUF3304 domain-containing protein [Massilia sp. AB1]MBQ5942157.1 DUF3304 domain-containing protein [Massilia sp. AB1]
MKIPILSFVRLHPIVSLLAMGVLLGSYALLHARSRADDRMGVSVNGVQHLGSDHLIHEFYVNKGYYGNVGEGGGGGSQTCCVTLPKNWYPGLKADVRWEVYRIIKPTDPALEETVESEGIYRAQVPVEAYREPGDFVVHFFPNGRVRIVVSSISPSGDGHPIRWRDAQASLLATTGTPVKEIFTAEEHAELDREDARDRAKYGNWR